MKQHEIISELIITNNRLSILLEFLLSKKELTTDEFNKQCKDSLEICYPFNELKSIDEGLRQRIQDYLNNASKTRFTN